MRIKVNTGNYGFKDELGTYSLCSCLQGLICEMYDLLRLNSSSVCKRIGLLIKENVVLNEKCLPRNFADFFGLCFYRVVY